MESIIYHIFNTYISTVKLSASIKLKFSLWPTLIIIIMGSYNVRHIYPIGYSRCRCGATAALIRQSQTHPHNKEPEIQNRILWEGVRFLACRRKPECPEKAYQSGHGIGEPNSPTTTGKLHW